jgi:hypothetical protein
MTAASDLVAAGFTADGDTFRAPAGSAVTVTPARGFYSIAIILPNGTVATCTIHQIALKVCETAGAEPKRNISDPSPASISSAWLTADR